jgi:hypothetical protein
METLWKNNFNSVTEVYDTQYVNFVIIVNIVSEGGKKGYYFRIDIRFKNTCN